MPVQPVPRSILPLCSALAVPTRPPRSSSATKGSPKETHSRALLLCATRVPWQLAQHPAGQGSSSASRCIHLPPARAQVSRGQDAAHCKEMLSLLVLMLLVWGKTSSIKKNKIDNQEGGYPALRCLSTPGLLSWSNLAGPKTCQVVLTRFLCPSESCFFVVFFLSIPVLQGYEPKCGKDSLGAMDNDKGPHSWWEG